MKAEVFAEYTGLTAEVVSLIEQLRQSPTESKSEILVRALVPLAQNTSSAEPLAVKTVDYGEGIKLYIGDKLYLFLSKAAKDARQPDARAEIKSDGFYLEGKKFAPLGKRPFQPAMKLAQQRRGHVVSLSAMRQWHVFRGGIFVSLAELKDPKQARKRGRALNGLIDINLAELGL